MRQTYNGALLALRSVPPPPQERPGMQYSGGNRGNGGLSAKHPKHFTPGGSVNRTSECGDRVPSKDRNETAPLLPVKARQGSREGHSVRGPNALNAANKENHPASTLHILQDAPRPHHPIGPHSHPRDSATCATTHSYPQIARAHWQYTPG